MSWIVKNVTKGSVFLNDVRIMFAPGEEVDIDSSAEILKNRGSDHLSKLLRRGVLQTVYRDVNPNSEMYSMNPRGVMSQQVESSPTVQSNMGTSHIDQDSLRNIIREVLSENKSDDETPVSCDAIRSIVREAVSEVVSELKNSVSVSNTVQTNSAITPEIIDSRIDLDSINAMIHTKRMDRDENVVGTLVPTDEAKHGTSRISDLVEQLRAVQGGKISGNDQ